MVQHPPNWIEERVECQIAIYVVLLQLQFILITKLLVLHFILSEYYLGVCWLTRWLLSEAE